jgi:hypothetical protein
MVVILLVAIRPQAIFLIVAWMTWNPLVGVNLFDMVGWVFVKGG